MGAILALMGVGAGLFVLASPKKKKKSTRTTRGIQRGSLKPSRVRKSVTNETDNDAGIQSMQLNLPGRANVIELTLLLRIKSTDEQTGEPCERLWGPQVWRFQEVDGFITRLVHPPTRNAFDRPLFEPEIQIVKAQDGKVHAALIEWRSVGWGATQCVIGPPPQAAWPGSIVSRWSYQLIAVAESQD